jgi:hypothetical protein
MSRRAIRMSRLFSLGLCLIGLTVADAAPRIDNVSLHGLTIGGSTTLVVDGAELLPDAKLILPVAIASQSVKPGATPQRVEFEVTLDPSVSPGIYALRIASGKGISAPLAIGVDSLPQLPFGPQIEKLPVALHGTIGGAQVLTTKVAGKQGQSLVLDCEARRIGSKLKPVVRLYDPHGRQIAWSPPRRDLGGDARCELTLPVDGEYTIELHDELYRGANPAFFRFMIGDLKYADLTLPLAATAGSKTPLAFVGGNLTGTTLLDATGIATPGAVAAPLPSDAFATGAGPRVGISNSPELVETAAAKGKLQELSAAPVGISGTLSSPGEEDQYLLAVSPGQKLRLEVFAERVGSPLDGVLSVRNLQGGQLATNDDRPGTSDPGLTFTVPAKLNQVQIGLKDLTAAGGSNFVYRIEVRDAAQPDFSLKLPGDCINVPAGSTQVLQVEAVRAGYDGPIELAFENLPSEIAVHGSTIATGAKIALVTLTASGNSPRAGVTRLVGRAVAAPQPILRVAKFDDAPGGSYQPFLNEQFGFAITEPSPIDLVWNADDNAHLILGGKLAAKLTIARRGAAAGNVRIRLITTQPTPKKTVKEGKQDKEVDDVERTLRLEGTPQFGPQNASPTVNMLVPSDLPQQPWDLVLVGDLLAKDNKTVLTSVATPVRTFAPVAPLKIELAGPTSAEGKAGAGDVGAFQGKLTRASGFEKSVIVTLDGLPKNYTAPSVIVPPDQAEFKLPLTFAFGSKPGKLDQVKLVALVAPLTATSVRSNEIAVSVTLTPGEKPEAEPPKEIFEDDEHFPELLTEGGGRAIPEVRDMYSGKISMRVTPDQKVNSMLPGLGVKIRENPAPGEYRYLRFAWKKAGGNTICLQLAHDGTFGPGGTGREGAKFRYHAGPGGECFGASLAIDQAVPAKFEVVTRDLFADFGEFTLTGLAFSPVDGQAALFDHLYLARQPADFSLIATKPAAAKAAQGKAGKRKRK